MKTDLVCGMGGDRTRSVVRNGRTYYFCSVACKEEFLRNPEKYEKLADDGL